MDTPRPKKEREQFGKETRDLKSKMDREVSTDAKGWLKDYDRYKIMKNYDRSTTKKPAARSGRKTATRKRGR